MKKVIVFYLLLLTYICSSQSSYSDETIGTWVGKIYGGGLPSKKIKIVITKAHYFNHEKGGYCQGYSLVNNSNKTNFSGNLFVECDRPHIEVFEPKTNSKNGIFNLSWGCLDPECYEEEKNTDGLCCGTWISYDKKIKRNIKVKKIK